jgi:ABC-type antimicrobial peptide transport system permease subunit
MRGRGFTADDRAGGALVAMVSESMAHTLWPNEEAIGKCIKTGADTAPCRTVVGVAENVKMGSFADEWNLVCYLPATQAGQQFFTIFLRVRGDALTRVDAVRRSMQRAMPGSGYLVVRTMSEVVAPSTRSWRLGATMFGVFGGLALAIAAIGLYGVVAYSVAQRTHEMGVRIALGARVADVVGLIVRDGLKVIVIGVALGVAAAMVGGNWLAPLLFDVSPRDPLVIAGVSATLVAVAIAASWLPALRASRVDPSVALRAE